MRHPGISQARVRGVAPGKLPSATISAKAMKSSENAFFNLMVHNYQRNTLCVRLISSACWGDFPAGPRCNSDMVMRRMSSWRGERRAMATGLYRLYGSGVSRLFLTAPPSRAAPIDRANSAPWVRGSDEDRRVKAGVVSHSRCVPPDRPALVFRSFRRRGRAAPIRPPSCDAAMICSARRLHVAATLNATCRALCNHSSAYLRCSRLSKNRRW